MQISEMTMEEVNARLAEINSEIETRSGEQLEEAKKEVEQLLERKKELEDAEKRAATAAALNSGAAAGEIKEKSEERKMNYTAESKEYRSAWLKTLMKQELTEEEKRAYASTDSHTAIPVLVADKFFEKMKKLAPMLSEITLMRVAGEIKFIAEGTRNAATKHTENQAVNAAEDTIVSVKLGANEFIKIIQISKNAANMSVDAFENWLVEMLSGDIARAIDDFIINDSTNGLAVSIDTVNMRLVNTATTGYTYKDICDLIAKIPAGYDAEAKFLLNKATLYGQVAAIADSNKRPIFVESPEEGFHGRILGYPVVVDDYVSKTNNAIYLGKLSDIVGNMSQDVTVDRDESAGFTANAIMFRGTAAFDSKLAKKDAIAVLVSTTS